MIGKDNPIHSVIKVLRAIHGALMVDFYAASQMWPIATHVMWSRLCVCVCVCVYSVCFVSRPWSL